MYAFMSDGTFNMEDHDDDEKAKGVKEEKQEEEEIASNEQ